MPKTLLLADDSPTIQRVVALTFAGHDVTVVPVSNGDQAVEALNRIRPDVVLADIAMPGRGGYELADYIRQSSHLASVPVLLLASAFQTVDSDRALAVGARGVLTKPFDPAVVVGRVRELLRESGPLDAEKPEQPADIVSAAPLEMTETIEPPSAALSDLPLQHSEATSLHSDLDRYFEQLDRAFDELKASRPSPDDHALLTDEEPPAAAPEPPPSVPRGVSLTDAFSALLAVESAFAAGEPPPAFVQSTPGAAPAIDMDALVEQVTARVLAQMSDRVVRETVSDIVVSAAERLVRDEIERIKQDVE